ncbi:MAG: transcriptional repressor LexA [Coriobacteriales bacterium]|jgi:repressor LexA|nr:transcriptional repressor LexA [Coriobacteriales bacterium]
MPENERVAQGKSANLTRRQRDVLTYLVDFIQDNGFAPSIRQIAKAAGIASPSTIHNHLTQLEAKGFIRRESDQARSISLQPAAFAALELPDPELARGGEFAASEQFVRLPLVGRIAAGEPILAEQNVEETYTLPKNLVGDAASFMLEVHGNSMIEAGINDGDYVVVQEQSDARNGEIVVALIDDSATVKSFYRDPQRDGGVRIRLQPQNAALEPIYPDQLQILGKVTALLRTL